MRTRSIARTLLAVAAGLPAWAVAAEPAATQPAVRAPASRPAHRFMDTQREIQQLREALKPKKGEQPLESAARRMGEAKKRLHGADSGLRTQEVQNQIVRDLETMIALLEKMKGGGKSSQKKQERKTRKPQPKRSPPKSSAKAGKRGTRSLQDSKPTQGTAAKAAIRPVPSDAEKWGFLPETLREEVLQSFKEDFLPRYRQLLEEYYSTLSRRARTGLQETAP